jgi:putative peptidoglycan lipid II flippase
VRRLWGQSKPVSINGRILFAMITIALCTALVKVAGMAKLIASARTFGTAGELDAWLIAFVVPSFIADSVAGSVSAALVPAFVEIRERQGPLPAQRLIASAATASLSGLSCLALLIGWQAPALLGRLAPGFDEQRFALAVSLMRIMLPTAVFGGVSSVCRGILNAEERFALPALAPAATPLAIIGFLLVSRASVKALAYGTVTGAVCELGIIVAALRYRGVPLEFHWYGFDPALKRVLAQYAPVAGGTILLTASAIVNQSTAARLGSGNVAILNYGMRLVSFVAAMGPLVAGTAVFPHFSRLVANGEWLSLRHTMRTVLGSLFLGSLPVTAVLLALSAPLVKVILQHGAFVASDTVTVAKVQSLALLQIPFCIVAAPMVRLVSALRANEHLLRAAAIALSANVILNYVLTRALGVAGIGLSASIVAAVYCCYLGVLLMVRLRAQGILVEV